MAWLRLSLAEAETENPHPRCHAAVEIYICMVNQKVRN